MTPLSMPTAPNSEVSSTSAVEEESTARYSIDLFQSFAEVCQKAKSGVQTCHVVAAFVQERANMESVYSKALLKISQSVKLRSYMLCYGNQTDAFMRVGTLLSLGTRR